MSGNTIKNMGHSVNVRLKLLSQSKQIAFDYLLLRYAYERFLYRLGQSRHAQRFILKGASVFYVWFGPMFRVTRDTDLLCHGNPDPNHLMQCFKEICQQKVSDDGIQFDTSSMESCEIKKDAKYCGTRIMFNAWIHNARVTMQFDVGFGDSVYPAAELSEYPKLLDDFQNPNILVYPRYTVVAEKYEAIVSLGMRNSRLKDYFDIWLLTNAFVFDYDLLKEAIQKTFERRENEQPVNIPPVGLTAEFFQDTIKRSQWNAFLKKVSPSYKPENLSMAVERIADFLNPFIFTPSTSFIRWLPDKGWQ